MSRIRERRQPKLVSQRNAMGFGSLPMLDDAFDEFGSMANFEPTIVGGTEHRHSQQSFY